MPNYVKNRITVDSRADEVFAFLKGEQSVVDFNKIVPMPEGLNVEDSSSGDDGMKYLLLTEDKSFPQKNEDLAEIEERLKKRGDFNQAIELGKKYLMNIANTGHKTWYDWSVEKWGTKWNALEAEIVSDTCIEFETAWSDVVPLIEKLSAHFPDVSFEYKYADEDTGYNCGKGTVINGVSSMVCPAGGSKEAYELAFDLRPDIADYYRLEDGNYISKED